MTLVRALFVLFAIALLVGAWTHGAPQSNCLGDDAGGCIGDNVGGVILVQ